MAYLEVSSAVVKYKWKGKLEISDTIQITKILSDGINFF